MVINRESGALQAIRCDAVFGPVALRVCNSIQLSYSRLLPGLQEFESASFGLCHWIQQGTEGRESAECS